MDSLRCGWFGGGVRLFARLTAKTAAFSILLLTVLAGCSSEPSELALAAGGTSNAPLREPGSSAGEVSASERERIDASLRAYVADQQSRPRGDLKVQDASLAKAPGDLWAGEPQPVGALNNVLDLPGPQPTTPTQYPLSADGKYYKVNLLYRNFLPPTASATFSSGVQQLGAAAPPFVFDGGDKPFTAVTAVPGDPNVVVTLTVDMGQYYSVGAVRPLYQPFGGGYPFRQRIRLATKLGPLADWQVPVEDSPVPTSDTTLSFDATLGRYLELTMIGNGCNLLELFVYPSSGTAPAPTSVDGYDLTSLGSTSTVNSNFSPLGSAWPVSWPAGGFYPKSITSGATGDAVATIDLGAPYPVSRLALGFFWSNTWVNGGRLEVASTPDTYATIADSGSGQTFFPWPHLGNFTVPPQPVRYIRATDYFIPGSGPSAQTLWSVQAFAGPGRHVGYYPLSADGKYFGVNLIRRPTGDAQPTASVVYANGAVAAGWGPQVAGSAIDGDDTVFFWSGAGAVPNASATLTVDLGQEQSLGAIQQRYFTKPTSSSLRVRGTLGPWTQLRADTPVTDAYTTSSFDAVPARHIELTMKGTPATGHVGLQELLVYPSSATDPAPSSGSRLDLTYLTGMAYFRNANMASGGGALVHAVPGAYGAYVKTPAQGGTGDGTLTVDLGQQYQVSEVDLSFYGNQRWMAGGKLDVDDGSGNWNTVFDSGYGTPLGLAADGTQKIVFAARTARYVRLTGYFDPAAANGLLTGIEVFGGNAECVANCSGKHCGDNLDDGCGRSCPAACGNGDIGCASNSDCQAGLACTGMAPGSTSPNQCVPILSGTCSGSVAVSPSNAALGSQVFVAATASCSNGASSEYRFAYARSATSAQQVVIREWSNSSAFVWDTAGLSSGSYLVYAYARAIGNLGFDSVASGSLLLGSTCGAADLSVTPLSPFPAEGTPAPVGTQLTLTGGASCGLSGQPEFQYFYLPPGGAVTYVRIGCPTGQTDCPGVWTSGPITLDTTGLPSGKYDFFVRARAQGNVTGQESSAYAVGGFLLGRVCTSNALWISPGSPQTSGVDVTLNASATCIGGDPAEHRYYYRNYTTELGWHEIVPGFATSPVHWNTAGLPGGNYQLQVLSRRIGNNSAAEAYAASNYTLQGATVDLCQNGTLDVNESDVDCGGGCGPCNSGKSCSVDSDCMPDEVCGEGNGACFGGSRAKRACWKAACSVDIEATGCGTANSACGQNCACVNSCDTTGVGPNNCASGEVCQKGLGSLFNAPTDDVCLDSRCPSNDPALCGSSGSLCGGQCVCTANCSAATCQNPGDGCGGICPGVCANGETGCTEDVQCPAGGACIENAQGVPTCRPGACAFRTLSPEHCAASVATCGECPACAPRCGGRQCGIEPNCQQSCGTCAAGAFCSSDGQCVGPRAAQSLHIPDGNGGQRVLPDLPASPTSTVGALRGQFAVSDEGGAQYTVPIEVPPGRAGMEPVISLNYSGSRLNGHEGIGWHIEGLSKITRCPRSNALDGFAGAIRNDTSDRFCVDGKRLESVSGAYGENGTEYRTLIDSFAKVISYSDDLIGIQVDANKVISPVMRPLQGPDWFKIWTKDGRILTFGRTQDSLMFGRNGIRYAWLLNRVEDRSGNTVIVTYDNHVSSFNSALQAGFNNVIRPREISYTGHGDVAGNRFVRFFYNPRADRQLTFFQGGMPFAVDERLSRITTYVNQDPVKSYKLDYGTGSRSQIRAIFECADGNGSTGQEDPLCKSPTSFDYVQESGFEATSGDTALDMSTAGQLDANGDGIQDLLATRVTVGDVEASPTLAAAQISTDIAISVASSYLTPAGYVAVNALWMAVKDSFWGLFGEDPKVEVVRKMHFGTGIRATPTRRVDSVTGIPCDATKNPYFFLDYDQDGKDDVVSACGGKLYVAHSLALPGASCVDCGKFQAYPSSAGVLSTSYIVPGNALQRTRPQVVTPDPIILDVNGDSLQDVVTCEGQYKLNLWLRQPPAAGSEQQPFSQGFASTPVTLKTDEPVAVPPIAGRPQPQPTRALLDLCGQPRPTYKTFDVDGDGTPDLLVRGLRGWVVLRYQISSSGPALSWQPVAFADVGGKTGSMGGNVSLGDFNNDGLADVWHVKDSKAIVWLNTGGGQFAPRQLDRPTPALAVDPRFRLRKSAIFDYNADGLSDLLENWQYQDQYRYNYNSALLTDGQVSMFTWTEVPEIRTKDLYGQFGARSFDQTADIDGDGNLDVFNDSGSVFFGRGARNLLLKRVIDGLGNTTTIEYDSKAYQRDEACGGVTWPEKCLPHVNGVVSTHTEGTGSNTERSFAYGYKNARMNVTGHGWLGFDQRTVRMTAANTSATSQNVSTTTTIDYEPTARYGLDGKPAPSTSVPYLYPFAGLARRITVDQHAPSGAANPPLQDGLYERRTQTINLWKVQMSAFGRPFPVVRARITRTHDRAPAPDATPAAFEASGAILTECTNQFEQDGYGNVTSDSSDCQGLHAQRRTTKFTPDVSAWLISNPDYVSILAGLSVTSGYGATAFTSSRLFNFTYENGLLATAERKATQAEGGASQVRKTTYSRDEFGNVWFVKEEVASEAPRTTTITYDEDHVFPNTITEAEDPTMQVAFEPKWGVPKGAVDGNGVASQIGYDGFGRATQTKGPDGLSVSVYSLVPQVDSVTKVGTINPRIRVSVEREGTAGHHLGPSVTEYDNYGRAVRTRVTGFGGAEVIQEQAYNALGQRLGRTLPHTADVPFNEVAFEVYSYDYLQRLTRVAHSTGSGYATGSFKEYQYASSASLDRGAHGQWENGMTCRSGRPLNKCAVEFRLSIDEALHQDVVVTDYLGRVIRNVDGENVASGAHSSNYVYNAWGKLSAALDNNGLMTQLYYDNYGRLTSRKDPDTSPKSYTYTYNGFDELKTSLDPKNQHRAYSHDTKGRLTSILDSVGTTPVGTTEWIYQQGRLVDAFAPSAAGQAGPHVHYSYEPVTQAQNRGFLESVTYTLDGSSYPTHFTYDDLGRTDRVEYPDMGTGPKVVTRARYDDSSGVLNGLDEVGSGPARALWRVTEAFQGHLIKQETFGSGANLATSTYDYNRQRRWLDSIQTTLGGQQIQAVEYTHYENRQVHQVNANDSVPVEYVYDSLNRLRFANYSPTQGLPFSVPYTYDNIGNLIGRGATITTPRSTQPHLIASVGSNVYSYDDNGNVSSRTGPDVPGWQQLINYTPFDLPSGISTPNSNELFDTVRFEYSADEERVIRRDVNSVRYFAGGLYQRKTDTSGTTLEERFRLYADGRQIGEIVRKDGSDETLFFHTDHLGSADTISDSNGGVHQQRFDPFGSPLDPPNPEVTRVGFTGQDHDNDLDLIDMKGRIYDPLAGRFTTPDPITQAPFWSQGLNRYSYVFNNPVNNTDPSGFMANDTAAGTGFMAWGGAVVGLAAAQGAGFSMSFMSGLGAGLGAGAQVGTSLLSGGYGGGSRGGSYDVPTAGAPSGSGVSRSSPPAHAQNKGGISELALSGNRPPWASLFDPSRGALAEVTARYNTATGSLTVTDDDTGESVDVGGESGGKPFGDPIPKGEYEILAQERTGQFRLDAVDSKPRDDVHEPTGRDHFRLHGPGRTIGCIACKDLKGWKKITSLINSTQTSTVWDMARRFWKRWSVPKEITKFGKLIVE